MALTTQCPFCQTAFRVVNDQLKIRGGLVRCGACSEVFNAQEHLLAQEPAASAPAGLPEGGADLVRAASPGATEATASRPLADNPPKTAPIDVIEAEELSGLAPKREAVEFIDFVEVARRQPPDAEICLDLDIPGAATSPVAAPAENSEAAPETRDGAELLPQPDAKETLKTDVEAKADIGSEAGAEAQLAPAEETERTTETDSATETDTADSEHPDDFDEPGFIKRARRLQRIERISRIVMGLGSVLLLIGALAQGAYTFRNQLAVSVPQMKPTLAAGCALLGCRIDLPARIEAISVEAIELQQSALQKDTLILTLLLRNRSSSLLAWPHIELSLNDANEKTIVRRVFLPAEYLPAGQSAKGFNAASEQPVRLSFEVAQQKPSGYVAQVFYP